MLTSEFTLIFFLAHNKRVSGDLSIIGHGNSHRVDLNANFPKQSGSGHTVEAETLAVINWIKDHFFVLSASIRGGTECGLVFSLKCYLVFFNNKTVLLLFSLGFRGVVYPSSLDSVDEDLFKSIAKTYYVVCILYVLYNVELYNVNVTFVTFYLTKSSAENVLNISVF